MQYTKRKYRYILLICLIVTLFSCVNTHAETISNIKPDVITITDISIDGHIIPKVRLTWNRDDNSDAYLIYRKTLDTKWEHIATVDSNNIVNYIDEKPLCGNNIYTIRGYNRKTQSLGDYDKLGYNIEVPESSVISFMTPVVLIIFIAACSYLFLT